MATSSNDEISEDLLNIDLWDRLDIHLGSYVKSPLYLSYVNSKTAVTSHALRIAIVDLIDHLIKKFNDNTEDNVSTLSTEHRLYHSRQYLLDMKEINVNPSESTECDDFNDNNKINIEISSLAPTIFYQLREDIGISNRKFRQSFLEHNLKDFTNPGKSGSLMFKTFDDLFILKTLREYEARLLIQILHGYYLKFRQRPTMFNRYVGLYSMRFNTSLSDFTIYIVIMVNAFTPSLTIHEIIDIKGSTINRKTSGYLSNEKLYQLKDMDFKDLYPNGIRIPTNIYKKLKTTLINDTKTLKKLNITDFSLILGIRHLDMSHTQMLERQVKTGITALVQITNSLTSAYEKDLNIRVPSTVQQIDQVLDNSYLRPLEMLREQLDTNLYYNNDLVARKTLPIPGIINHTNKRVYIYLVLVDMLQTFDHFKHLDQTFRKITDHSRHREYSVIEPEEYEQRFVQFLFDHVFLDAKDDFPWAIQEVSKPVADINNEGTMKIENDKNENDTNSNAILEFYF